jgi:hypothetical protein
MMGISAYKSWTIAGAVRVMKKRVFWQLRLRWNEAEFEGLGLGNGV